MDIENHEEHYDGDVEDEGSEIEKVLEGENEEKDKYETGKKEPNLVKFPAEILELIFDRAHDYRTIIRFRRVCKRFKGFLDFAKPDFALQKLGIFLYHDSIVCQLTFTDYVTNIEYRSMGVDSVVSCNTQQIYMEGQTHFEVFKNDTNLIWNNLKSQVEELRVKFLQHDQNGLNAQFAELLRNQLEDARRLPAPLRIKSFQVETLEQPLLMVFLPFLEPTCLVKIEIKKSGDAKLQYHKLESDQLVASQQFRQAKEFIAFKFVMRQPMRLFHYLNFEKLRVTLESISGHDVWLTARRICNSSTFHSFGITYLQLVHFRRFKQRFPRTPINFDTVLYLTYKKNNQFLYNYDSDSEEGGLHWPPWGSEEEREMRDQLGEANPVLVPFVENANVEEGEEENNDDADPYFECWHFLMSHMPNYWLVLKHFRFQRQFYFELVPTFELE